MGITKLIDPFYRKVPEDSFQKEFVTGQFCYLAAPQLDVIPWIMEVKRSDPTGHEKADFDIRKLREDDYCRKEELPLYRLTLRYNEELLIHRSKRRPGIIISSDNIIFKDISELLKTKYRKHLQQEVILVAPLFSIETTLHQGGFPPEMVARTKALMYNQFYYCPPPPVGFARIEGIARLDRLQVIVTSSFPGNKCVFEPINMAFTEEVAAIFIGMLREWLGITGRQDDVENLKTIKSIVAESLPV